MRIQLYDRGTPAGKKIFTDLQTLCRRLQIDYDPEYLSDMTKVYSLGIQAKTALLIDGEIALVDKYPQTKELENLLSDYQK